MSLLEQPKFYPLAHVCPIGLPGVTCLLLMVSLPGPVTEPFPPSGFPFLLMLMVS